MSLDLRPLTLGELLDRSFSLYRHHFWLFVGIMALPSLLGLTFGVLVALFNPQPASPGSVAEANPAEILGAVLWFFAAALGMVVVYFITYAVALGATTVAVSQIYMGQPRLDSRGVRAAARPRRAARAPAVVGLHPARSASCCSCSPSSGLPAPLPPPGFR